MTQTPQAQQTAAAAPRSAPTSTPTPRQHEADAFATQQQHGTLPLPPWHHAMDGSPIDPQSYDPTAKTSSWP
jgi:hypothetical protein